MLSSSNTHNCALRLVTWVQASSPERAGRARDSPYVCVIADLFTPLPSLPKGSGSQQLMLDAGPMQLDVPLHQLLFEGERSLGFDIALTADESARVHLAVHGRFSLGFLPLADFPALDFGGETPTLLHACLAPSLHALTLVVSTRAPTRVSLPDGTRQKHEPGTLVLGFRTGQLSRARHEIEALALSFTQCKALAERAAAALELAATAWDEAVTPFVTKLKELKAEVHKESELNPSDGAGSVAQELLQLLALGVPSLAVHDFLVHQLKEADLTRALKATTAAAETLLQLCVTHLAPSLEMLIHLLGHLHGLSKWPHHFAVTLGLQPKNVLAVLEAAEALRAACELLLVCSRRADTGMTGLIAWLIHAVRKLRDEAPPSTDDVPFPDTRTIAAYLSSGRPADDLPVDEVGDLFLDLDGTAAAAAALPTDALDALSTLAPIRRLPKLEAALSAALADCFHPIAQVSPWL